MNKFLNTNDSPHLPHFNVEYFDPEIRNGSGIRFLDVYCLWCHISRYRIPGINSLCFLMYEEKIRFETPNPV